MRRPALVLAALIATTAAHGQKVIPIWETPYRFDTKEQAWAPPSPPVRTTRENPSAEPGPLLPIQPVYRPRESKIESKTILRDEFGGRIDQHWDRFIRLRTSDDEVEVRGACESACTLVTAVVSRAQRSGVVPP